MKHYSEAVLVALIFILPNSVTAQAPPVFSTTDIVVKFTGEQQFVPGPGGTVMTGIPAIDQILYDYHVVRADTLFRPEAANTALRISLGMNRIYVLSTDQTVDVLALVTLLMADPAVEYAEPDFLGSETGRAAMDSTIPSDTYFSRQWGFRNTGSFPAGDSAKAGADIKAIYAWPVTKGDSTIVVAFLDSGVKWDHPDFGGRIWAKRGELPANGVDDDGNGYIDDVRGWNFAYGNNNVKDDEGHGTNVATIIGGKADNSSGYAGLDWKCKLMPVKILDSTGWGKYTWWSSGLYYATNNGARVINMSCGGSTVSSTLETAVRYAYTCGVFIAASMGNSNDSTRNYPAGYDTLVVAVGATDCRDRRVITFAWSSPGGASTYGSWIDVCAPGNKIYGLNHKSDTDFSWFWSGTSQASPMVAGLAALLLSQNKDYTPRELCTIIRATADDQVGRASEDAKGFDVFHGYGRINCYRAVTYVAVGVNDPRPRGPVAYALYPAYPNPFNPATTIRYTVGGVGNQASGLRMIRLVIYDVLGREVATLVDEMKPPGTYEVQFDARMPGLHGSPLSSGVYFYRLAAGSYVRTYKMVLVK